MAGLASCSVVERQERRNRGGVHYLLRSLPLTATEPSTTQPCPRWTTRPPSPRVLSMRLQRRHRPPSATRDSRVIPPPRATESCVGTVPSSIRPDPAPEEDVPRPTSPDR